MGVFWERLKERGFVYEDTYEGPYCVGCEEFKLPGDLVEGPGGELLCPVHSAPVEMLSESNWWFRLSAFAEPLAEHYRRHTHAIEPRSAYNEVMSFIGGGLSDISMSRSAVSWGIPLPWDDEQVVYVWFDALLNYITAIGYGAPAGLHRRRAVRAYLAGRRSPCRQGHPAVPRRVLARHAHGRELELPRKVFAHGWLLVGGEKMSKSKLTGISPEQITDVFGVDAFRYYFLAAINFGSDGSFSWEDMQARYTAELANGLGNLASRDGHGGSLLRRHPARSPGTTRTLTTSCRRRCEAPPRWPTRPWAAWTSPAGSPPSVASSRPSTCMSPSRSPGSWPGPGADRASAHGAVHDVRGAAGHRGAVQPSHAGVHDDAVEQVGALPHLGPVIEQPVADVGRWGQLPPGALLAKGDALFPPHPGGHATPAASEPPEPPLPAALPAGVADSHCHLDEP